jgi:hypothetical protein
LYDKLFGVNQGITNGSNWLFYLIACMTLIIQVSIFGFLFLILKRFETKRRERFYKKQSILELPNEKNDENDFDTESSKSNLNDNENSNSNENSINNETTTTLINDNGENTVLLKPTTKKKNEIEWKSKIKILIKN